VTAPPRERARSARIRKRGEGSLHPSGRSHGGWMSETGLARKKTKQSVCLLPLLLLLPTETDGRRRERETERIQLQSGPEAAQHEMSPCRELFGLACFCASLPLSSHTDRRRVFILFCLIRREEGNCHGVAVCIERGLMLR
jgi:hypothetical protein